MHGYLLHEHSKLNFFLFIFVQDIKIINKTLTT